MNHDGSYHALFSNPELVTDLLKNFVDEPFIQQLNFVTLKRENAKLHSDALERRDGDLIYYVETFSGEPTYLYLFLEFQSKPDKWMALRIANYVNLFCDQLRKDKKRLTPKGLLPPVFALTLYNGEARWHKPTQLSELFDLPKQHPLRAYQPSMKYYLIDESRFPQGKQGSLTGILFKLESASSAAEAYDGIAELVELLKQHAPVGVRRGFEAWIRHVLAPSLQMELQFEHIEELMEGRTMLKAKMQKWEQEYVAKGEEQGRKIGRLEGQREGEAVGRLQGRRTTLKKQLQLKFQALPDWAEQRIETATEDQLDEWACRLISCDDLAAILA